LELVKVVELDAPHPHLRLCQAQAACQREDKGMPELVLQALQTLGNVRNARAAILQSRLQF
jgi:hypothetical protein